MTELVVGSPLNSAADFDRLPIGTVSGPPRRENEEWTKEVIGWTSEAYGGITDISEFSMNGYNVIKFLPKGGGKAAPMWESLIQWQFRYRDNAFISADSAGVS